MPFLELLEKEIIEFKNVIEFGALLEGRKEVIRLVLLPDDFFTLKEFFEHYFPAFSIKSSTFVMKDVFNTTMELDIGWAQFDRFQHRVPSSNDPNGERVVFVGLEMAVNEAWCIEEEECQDELTAHRYGYPNCCGISYKQISKKNLWLDIFLGPSNKFSKFDLLANRFASITSPWLTYHFDYFPCSVKCEKTLKICKLNREMLKRSDLSEFVALIDDHLSGVLILFEDSVWYLHLHELSMGNWQFDQGKDPVVSGGKSSGLKFKGLRLESKSASALINSNWLHTDSGKIGIYVFSNQSDNLS